MDMTTFFAYARRAPFGGRLLQGQIDGINIILEQWNFFNLRDREELAYILATGFHETGGTMKPVRETFAKSDAAAIKSLDKAKAAGKLPQVKKLYWRPDAAGKSWFGRGYVQLTHEENYKKLGDRLKVDLVGNPALALDPVISAKILIVGMMEGLFTGSRLQDYFGPNKADVVGARAVVNGTDKAKLIATYYKSFLDALDAAHLAKSKGVPADVSPADALPDNVSATSSKTVWTIVAGLFGGTGLGVAKDAAETGATLLSAVSNPWAFGSLALLLIGGGAFAYLLQSGRITINRV